MKNTQRCLALLLSVLLVFTTIPLSVFALESNATEFAGGDGSIENPYQVSTIEQLNAVRNDLSASYVQINDIILSGNGWATIGGSDNPFTGNYNGNNYKIKNLKFEIGSTYAGETLTFALFCYNKGTISNVKIENLNVSGYSPALIRDRCTIIIGGIAGENSGKIENCEILTGNIKTEIYEKTLDLYGGGGNIYAGGICGLNYGTIHNCVNSANISIGSTELAIAGGICGSYDGDISYSLNKGDVYAYCKVGYYEWSPSIVCYSAGISARGNGSVANCFSTAENISSLVYTGYYGRRANAHFISDYDSENCYALKEAIVQTSDDNYVNPNIYITFEKGVTLTDLKTINNIWNDYRDSIAPPDYSSKHLYFENKISFLENNQNKNLTVYICDIAVEDGKIIYSNEKTMANGDLVWSVATGFEDVIGVSKNGTVKALSKGLAILSARHKDDINLSATCFVYVGDPNTVSFNCSYDTKYYYSDNAFVNSVATTSEYIDIQYDISNKIVNELRDVILETDYYKYFNDVSPITLTATVSGNDLSFSAQEYKNTYKTTISGLSIEEIINGSIKLFPYEMMIAENGNNYTVTFTLESESFDTIIKEYSFLIEKDSYNIKVYTSYPNSEIGVDQEVKLFVELYRNETLINCENGYSIVNSNSSIVKLTETKQSNGGYFFTLKGLAEGSTNFTLIDSITKTSRTIPINVVDKSKFIRCSATFDCLSADNVYITDYSCVVNSNGSHDISFNAYNWSYAYGVVEVYDSNGKILKVEPISPKSDGSGTEKIVNGFRYAAIDLTSDEEWYKKESNTKHTAICLENLPVDAKIVITSDGEVSGIPTLYTGIDTFVKVVLMASTLNVKTDAQETTVKALLTETLKSVPESTLKSASSELAKSMTAGATSESVSKSYEIVFNMFEGVGLDFGSIIKSTLIGMGYGAADSIVTTLIPATQVVFIVDDALAILQPIVDYSYNLNKGKVEIHITKHGLQNYLTNNSVTVTQESDFSKGTILDAYIVVEDDELQRLPDSIAGDMLYYNIYNITLRENGKEVQPKEEIEVRIPVPTSADGRKCVVYRIEENGERTLLQSRLDDNYLVFKTSHLSYYIVGQKNCEHSYPNSWSTDSEYHWKECTVVGCGIVIDASKEKHTPDHQGNATEEYAIKCTVCQYEIEAQLNHTHVFDKEVVEEQYLASKATCTNPAEYYKSCKCGEKGTETFASGEAIGHTEGTAWEKDATHHWHICTVAGCGVIIDTSKATHTPDHDGGATEEYAIKCSVCGYIIEAQLNHTHVFDKEVAEEQYIASKANCTEPAQYYKSCKCGEKGTETFASGEALGHTEETEWKSDADNHWHACTVAGCGVIIDNSKAAHTPDRAEATETDAVKCSVCGYVITPALGHTHAYATEWKSDKDSHWNECVCGDKANTAAHSDANKDGKCDVCEYEVATVTPDPDNKPDDTNKPSDDVQSPQTGDNSMMWLWIALLIVSGFGMIATIVMRKKFVR